MPTQTVDNTMIHINKDRIKNLVKSVGESLANQEFNMAEFMIAYGYILSSFGAQNEALKDEVLEKAIAATQNINKWPEA